MKDFNVIHCIDAANAALKCIVGHRLIKVEESKSLPLEGMILRLLVMTVSITGTGKTVTSCGYDGWLCLDSNLQKRTNEKGQNFT